MQQELIASPTPDQKRTFLQVLTETGMTAEAILASGAASSAIYLERTRDPAFAELWAMIDEAAMDRLRHVLMDRALVACGQVVEVDAKDPDTGELMLNDDFQPVRVKRLVHSNSAVMTKLIEKMIPSADKAAPMAAIQINNNVGTELPPRPRLVIPGDTEDG
ncbi:hypothetical protein KM031_02095 [Gemmobacter fulvus]|uniref:Terminase small subunit protein n=1 Tax=Gemmobacter fulvus TaxID=2840474 RepID=A0A975S1K5_9RHOB|nr:hypothetical protein [Gemmobacter fulvus]MBT9244919.1 hypothetical protein [Gemmobacter fulvus]QWK90727.1 hypothetical protein KM031_02095 [Gemmobacter fulvus]